MRSKLGYDGLVRNFRTWCDTFGTPRASKGQEPAMTHPISHNTLFAWYDGQLQDLDRQEVEQHVARCSECQRTYARWQQTARRCFPPPRTEVSDAFVDRLMIRIERLERHLIQTHGATPSAGLSLPLVWHAWPWRCPQSRRTCLRVEWTRTRRSPSIYCIEWRRRSRR